VGWSPIRNLRNFPEMKPLAQNCLQSCSDRPSHFVPTWMLVFDSFSCSQFAASRELTGEFARRMAKNSALCVNSRRKFSLMGVRRFCVMGCGIPQVIEMSTGEIQAYASTHSRDLLCSSFFSLNVNDMNFYLFGSEHNHRNQLIKNHSVTKKRRCESLTSVLVIEAAVIFPITQSIIIYFQ